MTRTRYTCRRCTAVLASVKPESVTVDAVNVRRVAFYPRLGAVRIVCRCQQWITIRPHKEEVIWEPAAA